eukprot:COSAG01_NODE_1065_length_11883_cov_104.177868_12_plen_110_part_00
MQQQRQQQRQQRQQQQQQQQQQGTAADGMAAAASSWVAECFSARELGSGALVAEAARRLTQAPGAEAEWSAWCGALELVAASLSQVRGPVAVTEWPLRGRGTERAGHDE